MIITRTISLTNFLVAVSALGFQVGVLYPWHKQLDDDFEALKKEHLRVLAAVQKSTENLPGGPTVTAPPATTEQAKSWGIREMLSNLKGWKV